MTIAMHASISPSYGIRPFDTELMHDPVLGRDFRHHVCLHVWSSKWGGGLAAFTKFCNRSDLIVISAM